MTSADIMLHFRYIFIKIFVISPNFVVDEALARRIFERSQLIPTAFEGKTSHHPSK
jgi:hypothetical protein